MEVYEGRKRRSHGDYEEHDESGEWYTGGIEMADPSDQTYWDYWHEWYAYVNSEIETQGREEEATTAATETEEVMAADEAVVKTEHKQEYGGEPPVDMSDEILCRY